MSLRDKYLRILSGMAPAGAAGIALLLGSTMPSAAARYSTSAEPLAADRAGVGERLAAIREAVSDVAKGDSRSARSEDGELHLAWGNWWRNWGARPRAENRPAGRPAHPFLQHRLSLLLPAGSELEVSRRTTNTAQSLLPGFRVGLGRRLPFGRLACRRANGSADRLLSRCVPDDRSAEARGSRSGAFVSDQRDPDRRGVVCVLRRRTDRCRGQHRRPQAVSRPPPANPRGPGHLRQDNGRHPAVAPA